MREVAFVIATATALIGLDACMTKTCSSVGCADSVTATFQLDRTIAEMRGGSVRVCRDDDCETAQLTERSPTVVGCGGRTIDCSAEAGTKTLTVSLVVQPMRARDGEFFDIVVFDPNGDPVASRRGTVAYSVTRPNGPECEPECRQGELK